MAPDHAQEKVEQAKRGLKRKLILSMLLVGALPLIIGLVMAFLQGTKEIREVSGMSFQALASETARKIDLILNEELAQTMQIATDVTIIHTLETRRDEIAGYTDEDLRDLIAQETQAWDQKDPAFIQGLTENELVTILRRYYGGSYVDPGHPIPVVTRSATLGLFITDIAGRVVATLNTDTSYAHAQNTWWKGAYKNGVGQPYIGNLTFHPNLDAYIFTLSLPIMDSIRYQVVGILHRVYESKEFFAPSIETIRFGKTGHVMLIDGHGKVMSCPILPTGTSLSDPRLLPLVTPMHNGWTAAPSDGHGGVRSSIIGYAPLPSTSRITMASTGTGWHMFVWQSSEELFAPIEHLFTWISVFGLLSIALLASLGAVAAGRIVTPIRRLQEAAKGIGRGQWQEPISIQTNDELEELADEMNRMNQQLASTFKGLESEVELKSQEVLYLQESTAQILDSVPDPVIMLDQSQRIQYMNRASREALALTTNGHVEHQSLFDVLKTDPSTTKKLSEEFHMQYIHSGDDATPLDAPRATTEANFRDPLQQHSDESSPSDGQAFHLNNQIYRYEWFTVKARPGQNLGVGLVFRDMTKESCLQDRLIKEEKLASLGVLSAGIGHELNNPLVGVIGLGEAIQQEESLTQIKEYAGSIVRHGQRMAAIIKDFTGLATSQLKEQATPVNINEELDQALHSLKQSHETASLDIQSTYQSLPSFKANPQELRQAFINIFTNAAQAMNGEGTLRISTQFKDNVIQITIDDTGPGIPRTQLSKIFDPFFTTKQQGKGAGLGLTIARRIIQQYNGQIHVTSQENQGTTCLITFPYQSKETAPTQEESS
ncbi:MAG: ATP-binding protein [Nitrospirales bacterium]|nr:HAMP domain-containing protein [Nitrospira sp.]MDR4502128.1 ATP-binding protein [Nitrospirales bacterium]